MKQLHIWILMIAAIILVVALQNRYKHVYVRKPHFEQQPLVKQFSAVLAATHSIIPASSYEDTVQPLFKELAYTINTARTRNTPLSITNTGTRTAFLLKQTLPHLEAEQITAWNTIPVPQKTQLFSTAVSQALTNTEAVKKALLVIFQDKQVRDVIKGIASFTDQEYLQSIYDNPISQQLFIKTTTIELAPHILSQLTLANLTVGTLPILNSLADQFATADEYIILANGATWQPMTLWFGDISLFDDTTLLKSALTRIYTLYTMRSWFRSPRINKKRFTPWYFLPTPIDKPFPQKGAPFTIEHLNSAQLLDKGTLYFRNEELLKNIVHETLHGLSLEEDITTDTASKALNDRYALERIDQEPLLLKEALIEGLTHIIHTLFTASEQPESTFENRLVNLWGLEKSFAFYQSAKMLYISEFDSLDEFLDPQHTEKRVKQTTAAGEYHLLKTALIHTPEKLLEIIINPRNKQQKLLALLKQNFADPQFKQEITRFLSWLKKGNNVPPLFTTGRLTVVD